MQQHPDDLPFTMEIALFHLVVGNLPAQKPADVRKIQVEIVGMGDVLEGNGHELLLGVAEEVANGAIDPQPAAVQPDDGHANGRVMKRVAKELFVRGGIQRVSAAPADQPERGETPIAEFPGGNQGANPRSQNRLRKPASPPRLPAAMRPIRRALRAFAVLSASLLADHHGHADAHIEDLIHLLPLDPAALGDRLEKGGHFPRLAVDHRIAAGREARAGDYRPGRRR